MGGANQASWESLPCSSRTRIPCWPGSRIGFGSGRGATVVVGPVVGPVVGAVVGVGDGRVASVPATVGDGAAATGEGVERSRSAVSVDRLSVYTPYDAPATVVSTTAPVSVANAVLRAPRMVTTSRCCGRTPRLRR